MPRTGRPRIPKLTPDAEPTQAERLAALLTSAPKARQKQLVDAIWDAACGYRFWVGEGKKPGAVAIGAHVSKGRLILETGAEVEGYVYEIPGDASAQKLLLDHGIGRPGIRELQQKETAIIFRHYVPGKPDQGAMPEEAPEPDVTMPEPEGVVEIGDEVLGYGAVFQPEPEDVIAGDDGQ
jgi:hypothetical protein